MLKRHSAIIWLVLSLAVPLQVSGIGADFAKVEFAKDPKIINGTDASLHATGHQVSIRRRIADSLSFGNGHICGGTLISENLVLSAAHCFLNSNEKDGAFFPEEDFVLVMGNLNRLERHDNTLVFDILKLITYADYFNTTTLADDIAILVLNGTVPASHPTVKPIILNDGPIANETMCQTTGWGINENKVRPVMLKSADVPYLNFDDCRTKVKIDYSVLPGMICAGSLKGYRGPCFADSGGPLVCMGVQAGIVSFGSCVQQPMKPTVYTDVAYYKHWILHQAFIHNRTLPIFASASDGVTTFSCSLLLITSTLLLHFLHSQMK